MAESTLPPEIWTRVFHYLSDNIVDVANCRLACTSLAQVGTEHLIPRIVVAKSASSLQRVWDVLEHPVFRLYVTELVYDASSYHDYVAFSIDTYNYVCDKFSSRLYLRRGERTSTFNRLAQRIHQPIGSHERRDDSDTSFPSHLDVYSGSFEYTKRWLDQETTVKRRMHLDTLKMALCRLPNLRKITYTDFRYLATPDETYLDLCQRLFGNVVEPSGMNLAFESGMVELLSVLQTIRQTPEARLRSLSIGGHRYEFPEMDIGQPLLDRTYIHLPWRQAAVPHNFLDLTDDLDVPADVQNLAADLDFVLAFEDLKQLRLPVRIPLQDAISGDFEAELDLPGPHLKSLLLRSFNGWNSLQLFGFSRVAGPAAPRCNCP